MTHTTVVYDAAQLVVGPASAGDDAAETDAEETIAYYEVAALAAEDGTVVAVGPTEPVTRAYPPEEADTAIDARGQAVIPGFVDSHTHALFAGNRSDEFAAKLRGKRYQEILAEGGGILRTVRAVRDASDDQLLLNLLGHLDEMLAHGSTTVEVKSGYGLDTETELRMLDVIRRADERHPIDVVPTFMGAHAVPEGRDADAYTETVVSEQLPAVADQGVAEFVDVFCEEDVFSVEQSRRVLEAGREAGLEPKIHAEEFVRLGGSQLAAEIGAVSADHLLHATAADARALAEAGIVPVLLPATAFSLGADYADPDQFLDAGAPVALASDFNPNCYSQSMPFTVALGCVGMGMTPAQSLLGATVNGAAALDRTGGVGTLVEGASADLAVLNAHSYVHVPYNFGVNPVETVLKDGEIVA
ncbi:MAG: imidazolonepropionase [Halolamina sp.]